MNDAIPAITVLGQDDWLFYARTADGRLVYTNSEFDWHWEETPHKHGEDLPYEEYRDRYFGSSDYREDNAWMLKYVREHSAELFWHELGNDTDGTPLAWPPEKDAEFIAKSAESYLPKED